jgi:hypothetical protein
MKREVKIIVTGDGEEKGGIFVLRDCTNGVKRI